MSAAETAEVATASSAPELADTVGWSFTTGGWSLALILPVALLAAWAIRRLAAPDYAGWGGWARRFVGVARPLAVALLILFLVEPSCTRVDHRLERPVVTVLVDDSQSMVVTDAGMAAHRRLDEAIALDLVPADLRDRRRLDLVERCDDLKELLAALPAVLLSERDQGREEVVEHLDNAIGLASAVAEALGDDADLADSATALQEFVQHCRDQLDPDDRATEPATPAAELAEACSTWQPRVARLQSALRQRQEAADAALVNAAEPGSPLASGLERLGRMSRYERLALLVDQRIRPALDERIDLQLRRQQDSLPTYEPAAVGEADLADLTERTDPGAALRAVAASTGDKPLAAVLLLGDGRFTAGGDPRQPARTLQARGARTYGLVVGDPEPPRDATVDAILGATEIFRGETIRLDVRFRIVGYPDQPWTLQLVQAGEVVDRREVMGTGDWQTERFERPAEDAGVVRFQARLIPGAAPAEDVDRGLTWQRFDLPRGIESLDDIDPAAAFATPVEERVLEQARAPSGIADHYLSRWQGFLVPEQTGLYRFALTGDDQVQFFLSTDADPSHATLLSRIDRWFAPDDWQGTSAPVVLRAGQAYWLELRHREGEGDDHAALAVQLPDGSWQQPLDIGLTRVAKPPPPPVDPRSEDDWPREASQDNNQAQLAVTVNEDPIKVLLVDARPRWDSRYLVALFERDSRVTVERRYRQIAEQRDQGPFLPREQEELDRYDLVVLGDLRPDELLPEDQERLHDFVTRRGGFLIVLAGPRGMPQAYSLGPLADVLPVAPDGEPPSGRSRDHTAPLRLTDAGREHAITRVLDDESLNEQLWPALPPLAWVARGQAAKTGAEVLLRSDDAELPVVVTGRAGAGRVLYLGSDETWRWRDRIGDRVHQAFWLQGLRWGLAERLRGSDPRLQVSLDRSMLAPQQTAELRARVVLGDGSLVEVAPNLLIETVDPDDPEAGSERGRIELGQVAEAPGLWRTAIRDLPEGDYRLTVTVDHPGLADLTEQRQLVVRRRVGVETVDLTADPAAMRRLCEAGGGRSGSLAETEAILAEVGSRLEPRRHRQVSTISLWNGYHALLLVVALLMGEWLVRKRRGLP